MNRWYILFCFSAVVHCKSFHTNQHLPLQNFQSPWRYDRPFNPSQPSIPVAQGTRDHASETPQPGDYNDLIRQYQQWQIAIPNQQQGGVVWISAPIYGNQPPSSNVPGYPPAPPPYGSTPSSSTNSNPSGSPTNQHTIVRDTVVTTADEEQPSTISSSTSEPSPSSTTTTTGSSTSTSESNSTVTIATTATESTIVQSNGTTQPPSNSSNPLLKYCKKPRGQFPDSSDCSKFINCWDGTAFEQSCPSGLAFNSEKEYCDYPENVNCTSNNSTNPNPPSSPPASNETSSINSKCPEYYGTHRNASNCAAFYVCVYGEPVDFACPTGTYYNDNLKVCDYEDRVDCKGASTTATPITSTESSTASPTNATQSSVSSSTVTSESTSTAGTESTSSPVSEVTTSAESTSSPVSEVTTSAASTTSEQTTPIQPDAAGLPGADPIGLYNLNLKKLPESIVNTGVRCFHQNTLFRLTPDCSSVTICNEGLTYIVNCGQATSFDAYSQRCVPTSRARC